MPKKEIENVTMRVRIGANELEVSGPSNFVEMKIDAFLKEQKDFIGAAQTKEDGRNTRKTTAPQKKMSVAQFFRKLNPRTDVDRVLAAGYYLEKFENYHSFTASEVKSLIRNSKINPPRNPNDAINSNVKKGLIMSSGDKDGKISFVLTTDGEDMINELLTP